MTGFPSPTIASQVGQNTMIMCSTRRLLTLVAVAAMVLAPSVARATLLTIDQVIYQTGSGTIVNSSLLSGTLDVTSSGNTLTILMTNTSPDTAFVGGGSPAVMLLTGFGLQLPGVNIMGGTVEVNTGSTAVNFDADLQPGPGVVPQNTTWITNQWAYANQVIDGYGMPLVPAVDSIVTSVNNGGATRFTVGALPGNINGPGYGAISSLETEFGSSTPGVGSTIRFVLTLSGPAPTVDTINSGNVVLAFGSPNAVPDGGTTAALLGMSLLGLGFLRRRLR